MIVLEPNDLETGAVVSAARALDNDKYYAVVDSGTNAIIVPLHPNMRGEIAECQVPSATVTGPIVQLYVMSTRECRDWWLRSRTQQSLSPKSGHYNCQVDICLRTQAKDEEW